MHIALIKGFPSSFMLLQQNIIDYEFYRWQMFFSQSLGCSEVQGQVTNGFGEGY